MPDFLLGANPAGDYTNTASYPGQFYLSAKAFPWVATATGTVTSITLKTDARTSDATDLELGLWTSLPGGDFADARLDYGAYGGTPPSSTEVAVTGLNADVVEGETYFIGAKAIGGHVYFAYDGAAGPTTYANGSAGEASFSEDAVWHNGDGLVLDGPPGLAAYGTISSGSSGPVSTEPQELSFTLSDLDGNEIDHLTALADTDGFTVTLNEARVGSCTISVDLDDQLAEAPREARHVVKVVYGDAIGINGIIGSYRVNGQTGRMTIPFRDSWLRFERREMRFGHSSVDDGYTRDGRGIQQIATDIEPSPGGAHQNGIVLPGLNDTDDDSHITHATRGSTPADAITAYTTKEGGGDVELVPVDETHPPTSRAWAEGDLCELAVWAFQGTDRTDPTSSDYLVFDYPGNLQDFTAGPDFEAMCNYVVAVANGGEIDADDTDYRRLATAASWAFDGILERWEAIDVGDQATGESLADYKTRVRELLLARARYLVKQYATAPAVIELVLPADRDGTPAWGRDYGVGDRVHVDLERGWWSYTGDVRVMSVQVARFGASGFATQTLQVIPVGASDPVDDTETGG